jgi:hypothetical protein
MFGFQQNLTFDNPLHLPEETGAFLPKKYTMALKKIWPHPQRQEDLIPVPP